MFRTRDKIMKEISLILFTTDSSNKHYSATVNFGVLPLVEIDHVRR